MNNLALLYWFLFWFPPISQLNFIFLGNPWIMHSYFGESSNNVLYQLKCLSTRRATQYIHPVSLSYRWTSNNNVLHLSIVSGRYMFPPSCTMHHTISMLDISLAQTADCSQLICSFMHWRYVWTCLFCFFALESKHKSDESKSCVVGSKKMWYTCLLQNCNYFFLKAYDGFWVK
jgi:hypothetical protein